MGQQSSAAYNFCSTACSVCTCCARSDYDQLDKLGLMDNNQGADYQSNALYDTDTTPKAKMVIDTTSNDLHNDDDNDHDDDHDDEYKQDIEADAFAPPAESVTSHSASISVSSHHNHHDDRSKFRAFIIAYNKNYGYLLLRAFKKGKGLHRQLPGGHIDKSEFYGRSFEEAAKTAAKRELLEETGLNIDDDARLKYLKLGIKNRAYFQLLIHDHDSLHIAKRGQVAIEELTKSLNKEQEFYLKLSSEHNGFEFEKDINKAIEMIEPHSGGKNSEALFVYSQNAKHERKRSRSHSKSQSQSLSHSMDMLQREKKLHEKQKKKKKKDKDKDDKEKDKKKKKKKKEKKMKADHESKSEYPPMSHSEIKTVIFTAQ